MIYSDANEKWAPVPVELYSKAYEVSNFGRVRSIPRLANSEYFIRHIHGGFLKGRSVKTGPKPLCFRYSVSVKVCDRRSGCDAFGEVSANA
jgi:hypothetical protein